MLFSKYRQRVDASMPPCNKRPVELRSYEWDIDGLGGVPEYMPIAYRSMRSMLQPSNDMLLGSQLSLFLADFWETFLKTRSSLCISGYIQPRRIDTPHSALCLSNFVSTVHVYSREMQPYYADYWRAPRERQHLHHVALGEL